MRTCLHALIVLWLALVCGSCSRFEYATMELYVRFDAHDDLFKVLEIERGIYTPAREDVDAAADAIEASATRGRVFPAPGGLVCIDLDKLASPTPDVSESMARKMREIAGGISIERGGFFIDDKGRLGLYRVWKFANAHGVLDLASMYLNEGIDREGDRFSPEFPVFDQETQELFKARSRARAPWFLVDGETIVFDVPMTQRSAARCLAHLVAARDKSSDDAAAAFYSQVTSLAITNDRALLRFDFSAYRCLEFRFGRDDGKYLPALAQKLKEHAIAFEDGSAVEHLAESMRPGPSTPRAK